MNLGNFLDWAAVRAPDKTAIICDGKSITYRQLNARAETLATSLQHRGTAKGTKAAVLANNSLEYVEIIFALMKLGAICIPLNHRLHADEIKVLAEHAEAALFFYDREHEAKVPFDNPGIRHFVAVGYNRTSTAVAYESLFSSVPARLGAHTVTEEDESCILYTAGTTGNPKGVVLTHGNQIWNTFNYTAAYGMCPQDTELAPTPLFHSSTLGRLFTYTFNMVPCILCGKFSPEYCLELIQKEGITSITQAPTMYYMMGEALKHGSWDTRSIKRVVTGASAMTSQGKMQLRELFPMALFYDLYGLTEAAPGVTILNNADFFRKTESVGKPMLSVETVIVDEHGRAASPGQIGEIVCRGPNVMKGYYKNPAETAGVLKNRWLHTGDMGMTDDEGFLYIMSRKKDIIISGGINIYPGEIEKVLMQHPCIADATVIGTVDAVWGEKVVAAVVLKQSSHCSEKDIIEFSRQHLAGFKCPRCVVFMQELPRNAAQKVLKHEVQEIYMQHRRA